LKTIGHVLEKTLKKLPNGKKITGQLVIDAWPAVVGGYITAKTKAVSFENGVLLVQVKDSVWSQHLSFQKRQIMTKLNRTAKTKILTDIRFVVGRLTDSPDEEAVLSKENWRYRLLEEEKLDTIEKAFSDTNLPPDLAQKMKNFFMSQEKRISWYHEQGYPACKHCGMPIVTAVREEICLCCKINGNG
jgi:hypothetical protein